AVRRTLPSGASRGSTARYGWMQRRARAPRPVRSDANADARSPDDLARRDAAVLDVQTAAEKVGAVVGERDTHGHRQVARTAAKLVTRQASTARRLTPFRSPRATAPHHVDAVERVERAQQDG